ncbi:uncharacterized protein LOC119075807 [Bradysia coprophila]|uniref:uncharacterized protein LOC119075807 n=1 Tax=Bradysia coprophila TaxID=38358 RepID=UPI00187DCC5C|nr:uncharacterized protein LOC119075807 [Bradysia coprophila]
MIFYKLLCIPPNFEIFMTGVYTCWCLCSRDILSIHHLLDKTDACWSTNGSEEKIFVTFLKYSVVSLHIFQFILAYAMLAAGALTIYPILFNRSAKLLNPIIVACTLRQLYSNSVAIILGALLCYLSGSNFQEFQCFFGRFLVNTIVSYYITCSYKDFQRYIRRGTAFVASREAQRNYVSNRPAICETRSENSFVTDWNYRSGKKFMDRTVSSLGQNKTLPSVSSIPEDIDSLLSTSSIPTMATSKSKEIFQINLIQRKTKADLLSFTITKQAN